MKLYFVPSGGTDPTSVRAGETPANPLDIDRMFLPGFLISGQRLILLPGTYEFPSTLDLTPFTDMAFYGDGKVIVDGKGELIPAIKLGSTSTVSGIRFKDCVIPLIIEDGHADSLVANCFDYLFLEDPVSSQSFISKSVTGCTFKNLTSKRNGIGISVLKGLTMENCLAAGPEDDIARPGFIGEILDLFSNTDSWAGSTVGAAFVFQMVEENFFEGENLLVMISTNSTGGPSFVRFQRVVAPAQAMDISRADTVSLVIKLLDLQLHVVAADTYRFIFESAAGSIRFDLADTAIVSGINVLDFDQTAPTATVGVFDPTTMTRIIIDTQLQNGGTVQLGLDHMYLTDSDLVMDFNAAEEFEGVDVHAKFKGTNGVDTTAFPVPFETPNLERFQYSQNLPNFAKYITEGKEGFPIGGIFNGGQLITKEEPKHLTFRNHILLGPWTNDELFFNTALGQPGPEAEGFAADLDESGATINTINGETVNLTQAIGTGEIRDLDDSFGNKFDKNSGALSETGTNTVLAAPVDATAVSAIGVAGEYFIPVGDLTDVLAAGLKIVARSAGGDIEQTIPKTVLHEGWNEVTVLFASPESSSGVFDNTAITEVDVTLAVDNTVAFVGQLTDHLFFVVSAGPSTGPVDFGADDSPTLDLASYPETRVGRVLGEPFLARNVGAAVRAAWSAIESADDGAFINRIPFQQQLTTRAIEIRFAELSFSRYGTLQGVLARDWTPIERLTTLKSPGTLLWMQKRIYIRNRTNVSLS